MECGWGIREAEEHDTRLKQPSVSCKSCFRFIALFNADVVVPLSDIKFGEVPGTLESADDIDN